jgi:hypothetical protein
MTARGDCPEGLTARLAVREKVVEFGDMSRQCFCVPKPKRLSMFKIATFF